MADTMLTIQLSQWVNKCNEIERLQAEIAELEKENKYLLDVVEDSGLKAQLVQQGTWGLEGE